MKINIGETSRIFEKAEKNPHELVNTFLKDFSDKDIMIQFFDTFPYVCGIFAPDGTIVFANRALCEKMNIANPSEILGRYNILKDPFFIIDNEMKEFLNRVFNGLTSTISNIKIPIGRISPTRSKPQNLMGYPIFNEKLQTSYIVLITHDSIYKEKEEIAKAKNYMHEYWLEEFNTEKLASFVGVSERHLQRLFKENTGETPFDYYKSIKIRRIKNLLHNSDLNVTEAFSSCGVDYNGTYAKYFKEIVGVNPLEYQKNPL